MSLMRRLEKHRGKTDQQETVQTPVPSTASSAPATVYEPIPDPYASLKTKLHNRLVSEVFSKKGEIDTLSLEAEISLLLAEEAVPMTRTEKQRFIEGMMAEIQGFGPIDPLLKDPSISEVMVNSPQLIYVERNGKLERSHVQFRDNDHVLRIIDKIVAPLGRRIDESSPMVDARLPDGSRVNAIIPPLALKGPCITIRKFSKDPFTIDDLVRFGTLTEEMALFLRACVEARLNVVVSGGTGSGKTTTLNVLSSFIPSDERIVTIEDAAELQLRQDHVITLETRAANLEGKGAITMRDLVKNSLRMRPDRIVVGEVRSGEALDMLQAMNTGHDGSITTGHANSPRDILRRLEVMVLMAGMDLPVRAIREQIASAVDLIVQQTRLKDGSRRITHITEVMGMEGEQITLQDIFLFQEKGRNEQGRVIGRQVPTGIVPSFIEKLQVAGFNIQHDWFNPRRGGL
ncbi:CpaF family protein [Brevibacillus migulae]|uniref:CpaF family protein n=1 Tax=Brevibacillus migulae TaxID=1644114 RepID=UPI00106EBF21|nr:CpaF family protein [Brevibacillus migulae]